MERLNVLKTYKLYIGGKFPRTESGRYYIPKNGKKEIKANMCLASRKDFRDAVVAARKAQADWASASAYNRSQVIYRIAEMLEGRAEQFVEELIKQGSSIEGAEEEVAHSIDRLVYFAGWCDKYQQIFSSVNPVASSYFNFTVYEPTGVVAIFAPEDSALLGFINAVIPVIAGGNAVIVLASENKPLSAISLAEVMNSSDVPGGVVNILTGKKGELIPHISNHLDVNAMIYYGRDKKEIKTLKENAAINVKRVATYKEDDFMDDKWLNPYPILDAQEVKTTWHPIENISEKGAGY